MSSMNFKCALLEKGTVLCRWAGSDEFTAPDTNCCKSWYSRVYLLVRTLNLQRILVSLDYGVFEVQSLSIYFFSWYKKLEWFLKKLSFVYVYKFKIKLMVFLYTQKYLTIELPLSAADSGALNFTRHKFVCVCDCVYLTYWCIFFASVHVLN